MSDNETKPHNEATPDDERELTAEEVFEQKAVRLAKRERLNELGLEAYPEAVPVTDSIPSVRQRFDGLEADATTGVTVGVAGRVVHLRNTGKLCFASLQAGDGSRLQAMLSLAEVGEESLEHWKELVDLGDHLFVSGEVISSRRGELSIMATSWKVAAKALLPLPNLHKELSEETRVRSRYLDLIVRNQARATVMTRATAVSSLRATFAALDFVEVETPMLQVMHGGAAARPFSTHSNAFDMELFLRIAPELFLKRAVVGGIDRVFEINRNFRNEGADSTHSPEFAMLEAYEAYGDYTSIAALTQRLIQEAATAVAGSHQVTWADGTVQVADDPYRFGPVLGELDAWLLAEGTQRLCLIGSNPLVQGVPGLQQAGQLTGASSAAALSFMVQLPSGIMPFTRERSLLARRWI
jgi:lysyl-tRNA synthetase class 2